MTWNSTLTCDHCGNKIATGPLSNAANIDPYLEIRVVKQLHLNTEKTEYQYHQHCALEGVRVMLALRGVTT